MDVVNQSFDNGFTALEAQGAGADGVAKLAFDNRVDRFDFPALPIQACLTGFSHAIGACLPFRISDLAKATNGRDQVGGMKSATVKAAIGQSPPLATVARIATILLQDFAKTPPLPRQGTDNRVGNL